MIAVELDQTFYGCVYYKLRIYYMMLGQFGFTDLKGVFEDCTATDKNLVDMPEAAIRGHLENFLVGNCLNLLIFLNETTLGDDGDGQQVQEVRILNS
jgi:hypothetical protein